MTMHGSVMQERNSVKQFAELIASELDALDAFVELLQREREALAASSADLLASLVARKNTLLEDLARCGEERARVLKSAGVAATALDIRRFVASDPEGAQIWEKVLDCARRASDLNTANAHLTSQRLAVVGRALVAITGARPGFYDPLGSKTQSLTTSRSFGKA